MLGALCENHQHQRAQFLTLSEFLSNVGVGNCLLIAAKFSLFSMISFSFLAYVF